MANPLAPRRRFKGRSRSPSTAPKPDKPLVEQTGRTFPNDPSTYQLIGTAGPLRLWFHQGRMTGKLYRVTNIETGKDAVRGSWPDYPSLQLLKKLKYTLPEGTPSRWKKRAL
jgi:hypothetical protein